MAKEKQRESALMKNILVNFVKDDDDDDDDDDREGQQDGYKSKTKHFKN